ncbi:hypothetical protein AK812_SmicGene37007 [Symbiodinium microadriaticum]|uniref:Uncharacterized protein n=1 Tax=Symbiodinium microadriaticum TaxID=2951 RepID=A0A1Q9CHC8_SYMMI|nr:hypothetical protein AK812_SmicGene37007 [Symbiodinium microadriaticum]
MGEAPPNMMLVMPDDPANLLIMPGRETAASFYECLECVVRRSSAVPAMVARQALFASAKAPSPPDSSHPSKIIDTAVVEDSEGPALVVGCDDGALYAWDLSGHDKGQIYAEMRSLSPMEVSALQMVSFAFGPAIPWKETVKQPAVVKIDKAMIFWPEMIAIISLNSPAFKEEMEKGAGLLDREAPPPEVLVNLCGVGYLLMQLLSTVLVVPICQSIAESINCVRTGNPSNTIYLASAPDATWQRNWGVEILASMV